ncbi:hypothetical protein [Flavobacterium branchiicola]|uniref:Lipoprotein n=1 Tax=Flavobacterium branchiicola TaxID=1114875 RepID=A0ABV9PA48_9FLAO|nr:hypothetical protein [Flavobacterium branchiicola]MBS7253098.1 hypothetical protein [Flavobacterium branchiicola]
MKKVLLIMAIMALISCKKADYPACEDCMNFYFENPQPDKDSELDRFPKKFRGLFMNTDSTFIRIEEDRILKEYFWKFKIHKLTLDSTKAEYEIVEGKLITKDTRDSFGMFPKGDSIELIQKHIDTLFRFSFYEKAKRIDGHLILSRKDSLFWNAQFISIDKNILKFKNLYDLKDLKKLDSVTKIKAKNLDSISYLIKPTITEFKKIFKIKGLGFDSEYKKVSR